MMDIVDRLRSVARTVDIIPDHNAIHEAADEIKALREKLAASDARAGLMEFERDQAIESRKEVSAQYSKFVIMHSEERDRANALQARVERLEKALRHIDQRTRIHSSGIARECGDRASAALNSDKKEYVK